MEVKQLDFAVKNFNRIKYENFRRFEALMLAISAHHALALHDIKYYFDKLIINWNQFIMMVIVRY